MRFSDVVATLEQQLARELPGDAAHARLAPVPRRAWPQGFDPARIRHAAGLLLVFPDDQSVRASRSSRSTADSAHIVLTVRADTLERHGGQVSLPGGVVDSGETFEEAALREAHEEIGLDPDRVRVIGALTPLDIPVSGFRLHPVVGVSQERPRLTAADEEVSRILDIDLDDLLAPARLLNTPREREGITFSTPAFHVEGVEIWGATGMVLAEFLALLGWP